MVAIQTGMKWSILMVLICISLIVSDIEYLPFLTICMSPFTKCLFTIAKHKSNYSPSVEEQIERLWSHTQRNNILTWKDWNSLIYDFMDKAGKHSAMRNKQGTDRYIPHHLTHTCYLKELFSEMQTEAYQRLGLGANGRRPVNLHKVVFWQEQWVLVISWRAEPWQPQVIPPWLFYNTRKKALDSCPKEMAQTCFVLYSFCPVCMLWRVQGLAYWARSTTGPHSKSQEIIYAYSVRYDNYADTIITEVYMYWNIILYYRHICKDMSVMTHTHTCQNTQTQELK